MRIVFSGAGPSTVMAARTLSAQGHEVIVIELDKEKIERLSDELDCSFLHGDAGKPNILRQVDPQDCDFLFCLTDSDQANIITALLGRSMGFQRVVTSIEDAELETICKELGLEDVIIPVRTMSRQLVNMVRGLHNIELSTLLKNDARFFTFTAGKREAGPAEELELPEDSRIVYYYRGDEFYPADEDTRFKKGDEIVVLTRSEHLPELNERWNPAQGGDDEE
jgi:trk system potassium uptake protein TrkA